MGIIYPNKETNKYKMLDKLVLRLLHFLIYSILFVMKFIEIYSHQFMNTLRYYALLCLNGFSDDIIVEEFCSVKSLSKDGDNIKLKDLSRVSICINDLKLEDE